MPREVKQGYCGIRIFYPPAFLIVVCCLVSVRATLDATGVPLDRAHFMVSAVGLARAENGFALFYRVFSNDRTEPQIQVFEHHGAPVLSISPLVAVPEAVDCTVWGVSAGSSGLVAVTAVFRDGSGLPPDGAVLVYNRKGELHAALRYTKIQIMGVEVDNQDHIWALNGGANADGNPKTFPVLVEYDQNGNTLRTVFTFSQFPEDAVSVDEGPRNGGAVSFGITENKIWFWFPQSRRFGIANIDGTESEVIYTGLPPSPKVFQPSSVNVFTEVEGIGYLPSRRLLAKVIFHDEPHGLAALCEYDLVTKRWIPLPGPQSVDLAKSWFAGVDDGQIVWLTQGASGRHGASPNEIELDWTPPPQAR
jgi:hypothetical protein